MLKLIKRITGSELGGLNRGIAFIVVENMAIAATLAVFCLFFTGIFHGTAAHSLWIYFGLLVLCFIIRAVCSTVGYIRIITSSYRITSGSRLIIGEHFRHLPMGFFTRKDLGALSNTILQDTNLLDFLFSHFLIPLISGLLLPIFIGCILAVLDFRLLALAVTPIFLAIPILILALRIIRKRGEKHLASIDKTDSAVLEYIQGIRIMKSYGLLGEQNEKLLKLVTDLSRQAMITETKATGTGFLFAAAVDLGLVLLLAVAPVLYNSGHITGVTAVIFLVIACRFYIPFMDLMQFSILSQYTINGAKRIDAIMQIPHLSRPDNQQVAVKHDILFSNVNFAYQETDVLRNINFHAPEKSMTALVGPSGSGKTTITNLMARFWDNYQGEIRIGGVELRQMDPEKLLGMFAFVFQDVYLFSDTILNNIWVGNRTASQEDVLEAARKAHCHEFISRLPERYETKVGEGGSTLSGGEKQRISIARAMLKDAPIVVLDEATTSLDPVNEKLIQDAVATLVRSKTLIVIAHRLNTIKEARQIVVLDKGVVVECGSHDELLSRIGCYRVMWDTMVGGDSSNADFDRATVLSGASTNPAKG
jgi:ATP-binding cassette subfamily B protein